jgi:hypothetical protein
MARKVAVTATQPVAEGVAGSTHSIPQLQNLFNEMIVESIEAKLVDRLRRYYPPEIVPSMDQIQDLFMHNEWKECD